MKVVRVRRALLCATAVYAFITPTAITAQTAPSAGADGLQVASLQDSVRTESSTFLKLSIADATTFVLTAPLIPGAKILVDGDTVLDLSAPEGSESDVVKAFLALSAGDHLIEIFAPVPFHDNIASTMMINELGSEPVRLDLAATPLSTEAGRELARTLNQGVKSAGDASDGGPSMTDGALSNLASAQGEPRRPFMIGGRALAIAPNPASRLFKSGCRVLAFSKSPPAMPGAFA